MVFKQRLGCSRNPTEKHEGVWNSLPYFSNKHGTLGDVRRNVILFWDLGWFSQVTHSVEIHIQDQVARSSDLLQIFVIGDNKTQPNLGGFEKV